MDLSKLPKLSETPKPPGDAPAPAGQAPPAPAQTQSSVPPAGPEVWISFAVGLIMLFLYPRFLQWLSSRLFGTSFNEFMLDGQVVPYPQTAEFWADLGPTLFGIVLILEALVLGLARHRALVWIVFALTLGMVGYNLGYLIASYSKHGFALASALSVAFGIYIAMHQWHLLRGRAAHD